MKRNPVLVETLVSEFADQQSRNKLRKMAEPQNDVQHIQLVPADHSAWEKTWAALDFDDEKASIAEAAMIDDLTDTFRKKIGVAKHKELEDKLNNLMRTTDFPHVEDESYTGCHLPEPMDQHAIDNLIEHSKRGTVLHPVYAMKLIVEAARIMKEKEHTLNHVTIPKGGTVVVVGDTHGQLTDLLTIFKTAGTPSATKYFIFNGDFVDRGPQDVSVLLILLAFKVVYPDNVFFNRGNHEQRRMNERYTFERHCRETYKSCVVYELFQRLFWALPLTTLINNKVLVIHGGLSHLEHVTLQELSKLPRGEISKVTTKGSREQELLTSSLWSDPRKEEGWAASSRGAGCLFGPDITKKFTESNGLSLIIRSHEMVDEGYLWWHHHRLVTLFSASNYCGKNSNKGAIAIFEHSGHDDPAQAIGTPQFKQYYAEVFTSNSIHSDRQEETLQKLREKIFQSRHALTREFSHVDQDADGYISLEAWAEGMAKGIDVPVDWAVLCPYLANIDEESHQIHYVKFLARYKVKVDKKFWEVWEQSIIEKICHKLLEHSSTLKHAFEEIDTNGNGIIEYDEFVAVLSKFDIGLSNSQVCDLMRSLDTNHDGHIDYKEFSHSFGEIWKSTKDSIKNSEHISWLKSQIEIIGAAIAKDKHPLREEFKKMAVNVDDRSISYEQFAAALKTQLHLEYTTEQATQLARLVDTNNSQRISWKEFKATFTQEPNDPQSLLASVLGSVSDAIHRSKTALRTLFYQMDVDGSGKIDMKEFQTGLDALNVLLSHPLTDDQMKTLYHFIDKDNDGFISYDEFLDSFSVVDTHQSKHHHSQKHSHKDKGDKHESHRHHKSDAESSSTHHHHSGKLDSSEHSYAPTPSSSTPVVTVQSPSE